MADNKTTWFLYCEDLAAVCVGPFPTQTAALEHRDYLEKRGDAAPGRLVEFAELPLLDYWDILTPEQDKAEWTGI